MLHLIQLVRGFRVCITLAHRPRLGYNPPCPFSCSQIRSRIARGDKLRRTYKTPTFRCCPQPLPVIVVVVRAMQVWLSLDVERWSPGISATLERPVILSKADPKAIRRTCIRLLIC